MPRAAMQYDANPRNTLLSMVYNSYPSVYLSIRPQKIYGTDKMISPTAVARYPAAMITSAQIRAARALLGWKQTDLAERSGVSEISIKNIERGITDARASTLNKIEAAFAEAGAIFLDPGVNRDGGVGVRLKP